MVAGRPRTTSLSEKDMIELGKEMLNWVRTNPDVLHLSEWYTIEKGFIYRQWKTFIQRDEFIPYYEQSLKVIAKKYLNKESNVREGVSQRWQRIYFADLREQEDRDMQDKIDREAKAKTDIPPLTDLVDIQNEKMMLQAELRKAQERIKELES